MTSTRETSGTRDRPNVVVVMTDQQRADACAREGFPLDTTPFLDSLAAGGVWFDRAYTATPVCAPARTSFLTGRYPTATNVWVNEQHDAASYDRDLFDVLNDAGYRTALVGKNHSYLDPSKADYWAQYGHWGAVSESAEAARSPEDEAFDEWLAETRLSEGGAGFSLEPTPFPPECQCVSRCVSQAREWIDSLDGDDPFFTWLSIPEPHNPYQVPEPYYDMFPPGELPPPAAGVDALDAKRFKWQWLREIGVARAERQIPAADYDEEVLPRLRSNYYGMLRLIDDQLRRFVEYLDSAGLREDTLLVFVSDHGDFVGDYGLMRKGVDLPEATARVPLIVDGPGVDSGDGPSDAHVSIVDLLPTICETVGADLPRGVQGRSLRPVLDGSAPNDAFGSVYAECGYGGRHSTRANVPPLGDASKNELNAHTQTGRTSMVRSGRWKLVHDTADGPELYDLESDPAETTDVSDSPEQADTLRDLLSLLASWSARARDTLPEPYQVERDTDGAR